MRNLQFTGGFIGGPTPPNRTGDGCPVFENVVLDPSRQALLPVEGYRRTSLYNLLTDTLSKTGKLRVVSAPSSYIGRAGGRTLAIVDEVTGRGLGIGYHATGSTVSPSSAPAPTTLGTLNRQGPHDYPSVVNVDNKTFIATPYDVLKVFDGETLRNAGCRAPKLAPTVTLDQASDAWSTDWGICDSTPDVSFTKVAARSARTTITTADETDGSSGGYAPGPKNTTVGQEAYHYFSVHKTDRTKGDLCYLNFGSPQTVSASVVSISAWVKAVFNPSGATYFGASTIRSNYPAAYPLLALVFAQNTALGGNRITIPLRISIPSKFWVKVSSSDSDEAFKAWASAAFSDGVGVTRQTVAAALASFSFQSVGFCFLRDIPSGQFLSNVIAIGVDDIQQNKAATVSSSVLEVDNDYQVSFSWVYSDGRESAPSPWSDAATKQTASGKLSLDITGNYVGAPTGLPNYPETAATAVKVFIHNPVWGTTTLGGVEYPQCGMLGQFEIPAETTDSETGLTVRRITIGDEQTVQEVLAAGQPLWESYEMPAVKNITAALDRLVLANVPNYSVGAVSVAANGQLVTLTDSGDPTTTPVFGPHLEGRQIRFAGDPTLYLVWKALDDVGDGTGDYDRLWLYSAYTGSTLANAAYEVLGQPNRAYWTEKSTTGVNIEAVPTYNYRDFKMPGDEIIRTVISGDYLFVLGRQHAFVAALDDNAVDDDGGVFMSRIRAIEGAPGCLAARSVAALPNGSVIYLGMGGRLVTMSTSGFNILPQNSYIRDWLTDGSRIDAAQLVHSHGCYDARTDRYALFLCESEESATGVAPGTDPTDTFGLGDPVVIGSSFTRYVDALADVSSPFYGCVSFDSKLWLYQGNTAYYSADGETWLTETTGLGLTLTGASNPLFFFALSDGVYFVKTVAGTPNVQHVYKSTDGYTFTEIANSLYGDLLYQASLVDVNFVISATCCVHDGKIVLAYRGQIHSSADGVTWTLKTAAAEFGTRRNYHFLSHDSGLYALGGEVLDGTWQTNNEVWTSADGGATWTQVSGGKVPPTSATAYFVNGTASAVDKAWVCFTTAVESPYYHAKLYSTTDFITWTEVATLPNADVPNLYSLFHLVAFGNGLYWIDDRNYEVDYIDAYTVTATETYQTPCNPYGAVNNVDTLASDFNRGLLLDFTTGIMTTLRGWPIVATAFDSAPCSIQGTLPDRIISVDTLGYVNRLFSPDAYGLGTPQRIIACAVTASDSTTVTVDSVLPTGQDGLLGLTVTVLSVDGSMQVRTIINNTPVTVAVDTAWDTNPVTTDIVYIGGMLCTVRFAEVRATDTITPQSMMVDMDHTGEQDQAFVTSLYIANDRLPYVKYDTVAPYVQRFTLDTSGDTLNYGLTSDGGLAVAYQLNFLPTGQGRTRIAGITVEETGHAAAIRAVAPQEA